MILSLIFDHISNEMYFLKRITIKYQYIHNKLSQFRKNLLLLNLLIILAYLVIFNSNFMYFFLKLLLNYLQIFHHFSKSFKIDKLFLNLNHL